MGVSPKKGIYFLHKILNAAFLEVSPGGVPSVPSNPPLMKWRELVLFFGLYYPPSGNFSADVLNLRL